MYCVFFLLTLILPLYAKPNNVADQIKAKKEDSFLHKKIGPKLVSLGLHPDPNFQIPVRRHKVGKTVIPEAFDARKQWPECEFYIRSARDQGNCNASWAFAAAEVMTDRLCIQSGGKVKFEVSPEDLISCCKDCGGCDGGYTYPAWEHLVKTGVVSGGDYPTTRGCKPYSELTYLRSEPPTCNLSCPNDLYHIPYNEDKHYATNITYLIAPEVEQIQLEIMTSGPVIAVFKLFDDFGHFSYSVYRHLDGGLQRGYHAIKIIGWSVNNGTPYWLTLNSRGSLFGDHGMIMFMKGTNECSIEEAVLAGEVLIDGTTTTTTTVTTPHTDGTSTSHSTRAPNSSNKIAADAMGLVVGSVLFYMTRL